jgi:iron uptake system component EfeO
MWSVTRLLVAMTVVGMLSVGCSPNSPFAAKSGEPKAAAKASGPQTIAVVASDLKYEPKALTARPGSVTFSVKNEGAIEHNFIVETTSGQQIARIANIEVGKTETVSAEFAAGTYSVVCTLPGHKEAGMVGTLTVAP